MHPILRRPAELSPADFPVARRPITAHVSDVAELASRCRFGGTWLTDPTYDQKLVKPNAMRSELRRENGLPRFFIGPVRGSTKRTTVWRARQCSHERRCVLLQAVATTLKLN